MADRKDVLLKEYEGCRQHNISYASQYWIIVGIFMAINTALLGGVAYSIATNSTLLHEHVKWLVLVLGGGMIIILLLLMFYVKRVTYVIRFNYGRMREIEAELGMWQSWRVHGVDHWKVKENNFDNKISDEMKHRLICYHPKEWWEYWRRQRGYKGTIGPWIVKGLFFTVIMMWLIFIAAFIFLMN